MDVDGALYTTNNNGDLLYSAMDQLRGRCQLRMRGGTDLAGQWDTDSATD
jgi:hypothetical protein